MAVRREAQCRRFHGLKNAINYWIVEFEKVWKICISCIRHFGSNPSFGWRDRSLGRLSIDLFHLSHQLHYIYKFNFICSSKFWRKLVYIRTLEELYQHIPVEKAAVPEKVKRFDMKYV